jgi:hypothetical protein
MQPSAVVTYELDDSTLVRFEIDPPAGFQDAGANKVIGKVQEALSPAIDTAKLIMDKLKEAKPGEVTVTFGVKVSGKLDWFIARAGTEGNFQITLTWHPGESAAASSTDDASDLSSADDQASAVGLGSC